MTSISEFKKSLRKHSKSGGARYQKVDLHVHAPTPDDYEYKGEDAFEQLGNVIRTNDYSLVVLLEHESFPPPDKLERLRRCCPSTTILPGAEINVFVDVLDKKVSKDHFFHCLIIADPDQSREPGYLIHRAKESLTYHSDPSPSGFHSAIDDVAKLFLEQGALFIPAHLHQSRSPEVSRSIDDIYSDDDFLGFVGRGIFSALEVRSLDTAKFFDEKHTTQDGRPIPGITCVRCSDAHSHQHIVERNRATWIQAEEPTFSELQAALSFPHRVALEAPQSNHAQILGMHVAGQFLADEWITLSPAMNCFIGCKGTGKTAVLECLRFLLGAGVPKERRESVDKHIGHILGAAGSVECLVRAGDGNEYLLVRRANSPDRLSAVDAQGVTREVKNVGEIGFDASILGWHEIEGVADHAHERVRLIDHIENPAEIADQVAHIEQSIEAARDLLPAFQRKVHRLDEVLREWWLLKKKRATLKKLQDASLFDLQNKYESYVTWEQRLAALVGDVTKASTDISTSVGNKLQPLEESVASPVQEPSDLCEAVNRVRSQIASIRRTTDATLSTFAEVCSAATAAIEQESKTISGAFLKFRQTTYEPTVATLPPEDREILSRQIQTIEETKNLPQVEQRCKNIQREVSDLARSLHSHCEAICTARDCIAAVREGRVNAVNAESSSIRLKLLRSSDHARRDQFRNSYGQDGAAFTSFIDGYEGAHSYQKLKRLFASFIDLNTEEETWSVKDLLLDAKFVEFLRVIDDDDVEIALVVGKAGPIPIQSLSAGQRCTAVFPLLLRNNRKPLVIDQPEDNLDNRYIADAIAPELLSKKRQQQFILTSHNANLVVLTDAELICQFDSDGKTGTISERGFLACGKSRVKSAVVDVLDGGETALEARRRKYGHSQ
jgi:DNA repair ATPase RecN